MDGTACAAYLLCALALHSGKEQMEKSPCLVCFVFSLDGEVEEGDRLWWKWGGEERLIPAIITNALLRYHEQASAG